MKKEEEDKDEEEEEGEGEESNVYYVIYTFLGV